MLRHHVGAGANGAGSAAAHMHEGTQGFETAVWAAVEGYATEDQLAMLEADTAAWRRTLERLIDDVDDQLAHINDTLHGAERAQVVADFENEIARLEAAYDLLARADDPVAAIAAADPAGEVRLQASWSARKVVVWAAGPEARPANNDELADRLEAIGGPRLGWSAHPDVVLP